MKRWALLLVTGMASGQAGPVPTPEGLLFTPEEVKRVSDELDRRAAIIIQQDKEIKLLRAKSGCA